MKNLEREFKWDASTPQAFARFVCALQDVAGKYSAPQQLQNTDYYLEDAARQLVRQKVALRIRHSAGHWEATLKTRTVLKEGLACRQEWTLPLPGVQQVRQAIKALAARGEWKGVCLGGLRIRFIIRNKRTIYTVSYVGCQAEAALDNYLTLAQGHQWRRKEIELELKKGKASDFEKLVQKITEKSNLKAAKISKVAGAEKWILHEFRKD